MRVAHGTVRCGHCMNTFDALEALDDGDVERLVRESAIASNIQLHGDRTLLRPNEGRSNWGSRKRTLTPCNQRSDMQTRTSRQLRPDPMTHRSHYHCSAVVPCSRHNESSLNNLTSLSRLHWMWTKTPPPTMSNRA
ncbi:MAG: hypothetical protein CMO26_15360 [Thiotrichales bacterium]|nr:hypothetical protein [Thiotrichales bacterium]